MAHKTDHLADGVDLTARRSAGKRPHFVSLPRDTIAPGEPRRSLERRAAQQRAFSALAQLALETRGSDELLDAAARCVAEALRADRAAVIEMIAGATGSAVSAVMRAGHGWPPGTPLAIPLEPERDAGAIELSPARIVEGDDALELLPPAWRPRGTARVAVSGVRRSETTPGTMIVAVKTVAGGFEPDELTFLEAVGDVLAAALKRNEGEERTRHEAMHDALTGLANRTLFADRLQHAVARTAPGDGTVTVLILDLDRFSIVNETLGHELGDELLVAVAQRMLGVLGADHTLARISGDEFAILCEGFTGERGAIELAERVLRALERPVVLGEHETFIAASMGIVVATGRGASAESLLRDADAALYRAKQQGGRYELFDQAMRRRTLERLDLERDMRRALDQHEFELHYQPIVSLEEQRIVGLEALVRWRHPQRGLVPPGAFIPLAEDSGLIVPLGRWVLQEACRQLARWSADPAIEIPYVSVNLSGRQLAQPDLPEEIAELLRVTGVAPRRLALELTESVLMEETDSPTAVVERLNALGVRLMLDDFGTGYSSLNYVKRFPIEAIKVDRSFVSGVSEDESDRHILRAIVSMAAGFDVSVIAEGVETPDQARWLRHLGITLAQGYGFGRPVPASATEPLLRDGLALDALAEAFEPLQPAETSFTMRAAGGSTGEQEPTMTLGDAAEALSLSTSTLRRWADAGRIKTLRTSGGHRRFALRDVQRLSAARSARHKATVRSIPTPVEPLPDLSDALRTAAPELATTCARAVYEGAHTGWFGSRTGRQQVERWALAVAVGARTGEYETAIEATRKLMLQASVGGASLLERHTMLERLGDAIARDLQGRGTHHAQLLSARRLLLCLRQLALEGSLAA
jgi:diguanylate cyclase (GGDEF)-like protein/excisionase family DNA binding protein